MARCRSCFKSGLFLKVNDRSFCRDCEKTYTENIINYYAGKKDSISQRKTNYCMDLAGVNESNPDTGINRQKIIKYSKTGEKLMLVLDSNRPHSKEAIRVLRFDGQQLGYLDTGDYSDKLNNQLRENIFFDVFIDTVFNKNGKYGAIINLTPYN